MTTVAAIVAFALLSVWFVNNHNSGLIKLLLVQGKVVGENGEAIPNAMVRAHFGIVAEGPEVKSSENGEFNAYVYNTVSYMRKGPPSITITKPGYNEKWIYYKDWKIGPRMAIESVLLQKNN